MFHNLRPRETVWRLLGTKGRYQIDIGRKTRHGAGDHSILKVDHAPTYLVCCLPLYTQACLVWLFHIVRPRVWPLIHGKKAARPCLPHLKVSQMSRKHAAPRY